MIFMMNLIFIISFLFIFMNHPLSMGIMLLIQTILITLILGFMSFNWWFSYILFLIMIGGMLILFIYMTSIASNEKFKYSVKISLLSLIMFMILNLNLMLENFIMEFQFFYTSNLTLNLNKFLNFPNNLMLVMMMIYLFIVLIAVVKISNPNYGPLRQMN